MRRSRRTVLKPGIRVKIGSLVTRADALQKIAVAAIRASGVGSRKLARSDAAEFAICRLGATHSRFGIVVSRE